MPGKVSNAICFPDFTASFTASCMYILSLLDKGSAARYGRPFCFIHRNHPLRCVVSSKAQKIVSRTVEDLSHLDELFGWDLGFAGLPAFECVIADANGLGKTGLCKPGSRNLGIDVRVKQDITFLSFYPVWANFNFIVIPYGLYVNWFLKLFFREI